ncbi:MAG TPA: hypothetical protein VFS70_09295 [Actinomycetota bacterium]|nr:hypothetical protein [Actinomycetota bacterium]
MGRILAHGLGGRSDLPVPMYLAQYGAAVALIFSFAALRTFWRTPRLEHAGDGDGRTLPPPVQRLADAPATRAGLRVLGLFLAGITVAAAAFGPDDPVTNPAPTWLYIWFWVGLVPASLLLGPIWRLLNPLRTLSAGLDLLRGRPGGAARAMPPWLGYWPAAASLAVFAWLELVYADASLPSTVLAFLLTYGLVNLAASRSTARPGSPAATGSRSTAGMSTCCSARPGWPRPSGSGPSPTWPPPGPASASAGSGWPTPPRNGWTGGSCTPCCRSRSATPWPTTSRCWCWRDRTATSGPRTRSGSAGTCSARPAGCRIRWP